MATDRSQDGVRELDELVRKFLSERKNSFRTAPLFVNLAQAVQERTRTEYLEALQHTYLCMNRSCRKCAEIHDRFNLKEGV